MANGNQTVDALLGLGGAPAASAATGPRPPQSKAKARPGLPASLDEMALMIQEMAGSEIGGEIAVGFMNRTLAASDMPFRIPNPREAAAQRAQMEAAQLKAMQESSAMKVVELAGFLQTYAETPLEQITEGAAGSKMKLGDLITARSKLGRLDTGAIFDNPDQLLGASQVVAELGRAAGDPLLEQLALTPADLLRFQTSGMAGQLRSVKTEEELGAEKLSRTAGVARNLGVEGGLAGVVEDVTEGGDALGGRLDDALEAAGVDLTGGLDFGTNIDEATGAQALRGTVNRFVEAFRGQGMDAGLLYGAVLAGRVGSDIEGELNNLDVAQNSLGLAVPVIEDRADVNVDAQKELLALLAEAARARGVPIATVFAEMGLPFEDLPEDFVAPSGGPAEPAG